MTPGRQEKALSMLSTDGSCWLDPGEMHGGQTTSADPTEYRIRSDLGDRVKEKKNSLRKLIE